MEACRGATTGIGGITALAKAVQAAPPADAGCAVRLNIHTRRDIEEAVP